MRKAAHSIEELTEADLADYIRNETQNPSTDVWTYKYDALGRRVTKSKSGEAHYYFYDGSRVILEVVDTGSATVREYIYGNAIDEVLIERLPDGSGTATVWPVTDSDGTIRELAEWTGATLRLRMSYTISESGNLQAEVPAAGTSAIAQDRLFKGMTFDRESGLYYVRFRCYDVETARFVNRDPAGQWTDSVQRGNAYCFAGNDPVNNKDPEGTLTIAGITVPHVEGCKPVFALFIPGLNATLMIDICFEFTGSYECCKKTSTSCTKGS
jgi:RHS repeat-associated protein